MEAAAQVFVQEVIQGTSIPEAVTTFCEEVLAGVSSPASDHAPDDLRLGWPLGRHVAFAFGPLVPHGWPLGTGTGGFITCYRCIPWMVAGPAVCHAEPVDAGERPMLSPAGSASGWVESWLLWASTPPAGFIWASGRLWQPGSSCGGCSTVSRPSLDKILAKTGNWGYNRCNSKMRNCHDKFIAAHVTHGLQKPARYTGGEYNQVVKPLDQVDVRIAFLLPDTYVGHVQSGDAHSLRRDERDGRGLV